MCNGGLVAGECDRPEVATAQLQEEEEMVLNPHSIVVIQSRQREVEPSRNWLRDIILTTTKQREHTHTHSNSNNRKQTK